MIEIQDGRVFNREYQDIYFSQSDGMAEVDYVFLRGNDLYRRFAEVADGRFTIGELGFGTGLNFLLARRLFLSAAPPTARLDFVSFEKHLPSPAQSRRSLSLFPELREEGNLLRKKLRAIIQYEGCHSLDFGRVRLLLYLGDARKCIQDFDGKCDAWFLDGFAPARNPQMWEPALMASIRQRCNAGATMASFTAAGAVRRSLEEAGFRVERIKGFGSKKHMIRGHCPEEDTESQQGIVPLDDIPTSSAKLDFPGHSQRKVGEDDLEARREDSVRVVGAGLAGLATAYALTRRGIAVELIDRSDRIASGASGNLAGMASIAFTAEPTAQSLISIRALEMFASWAMDRKESWNGMRGLKKLEESQRYEDSLRSHGLHRARLFHGLQLSIGGAVSPAELCAYYFRASMETGLLEWKPSCDYGEASLQEDIVGRRKLILCNANGIGQLGVARMVSYRPVRGQVIHLDLAMKQPLTNQIYVVPSPVESHISVLGATFDMHLDSTERLPERDRYLVDQMREWLPQIWESLDERERERLLSGRCEGRVGFRCQSRDYLPVCGELPDSADFLRRWGDFYRWSGKRKKDTDIIRESAAAKRTGLFINACHGSRGITTSFLGAEVIASALCNEPAPLESALLHSIDPIRFLWREVRRAPEQRTEL